MGGRGCIYCTWLGYIYLADGLIDNGLSFISCINFPKVQKFMVSLLWPNPPPTDRVFKMLLILDSLRSCIKLYILQMGWFLDMPVEITFYDVLENLQPCYFKRGANG